MTNVTLGASVLLLSFAAFTANTYTPDRSYLRSLTETELKTIYIHCEQLAASTLLDFDSAAHCSKVSEELLERSFGGNFDRLLEWWHRIRQVCGHDADCAKDQVQQTERKRP